MAFTTTYPSMMAPQDGYAITPILTIGDTVPDATGAYTGQSGDYTPVGILDGMGGYAVDADTVRMFVNHELRPEQGKLYTVNNDVAGVNELQLTGARISYVDINTETRAIEDAGQAYNRIYDVQGVLVTNTDQLDTDPTDGVGIEGLNRFCSASLFEAEEFGPGHGFADRMYFGPSEDDNGVYWALDTEQGDLWAAPMLGRGAWENLTAVDTGNPDTIGLLLGDDDFPANMLYLYVGEKNAVGDGSFLDRNGLAKGSYYVWTPDVNLDDDPTNDISAADIGRPGQNIDGAFVAIEHVNADKAGSDGYDSLGYALQDTLRAQGDALGAMWFSRTEDLATNPADGTQAVFANTGTPFPGTSVNGIPNSGDESFPDTAVDDAGSLYIVDLDFAEDGIDAKMSVLYSGDADAQNPANAVLRSPDNLDWADDGTIYAQEDEANVDFGDSATPREAAIIRIDPALQQGEDGFAKVVAIVDRSAVAPAGTTDSDPENFGEWESSGIVDVSSLFDGEPGSTFLFDVQAHSLTDGLIEELGLVQGGQLSFLDADMMIG